MKNLNQILLIKFKKQCLAHFYVLQANLRSSSNKTSGQFLSDWINTFLLEVIGEEKKMAPKDAANILKMGHPDILTIYKTSKSDNSSNKDYTVEEFDDFFSFQNYGTFEFKQKFIVIFDAHLISKMLANKLLKTLEAPQKNTTIFFLNPYKKTFLPTISSRAIVLTVNSTLNSLPNPTDKLYHQDNIIDWFESHMSSEPQSFSKDFIDAFLNFLRKKEGPFNVIDILKNNKSYQDPLISILLEWERRNASNYQQKDQFLEQVQWFQTAKTFHNPAWERFLGIIINYV